MRTIACKKVFIYLLTIQSTALTSPGVYETEGVSITQVEREVRTFFKPYFHFERTETLFYA